MAVILPPIPAQLPWLMAHRARTHGELRWGLAYIAGMRRKVEGFRYPRP